MNLFHTNTVYLIKTGSRAAGMDVADSDVDLRSVYCPRLEDMINGFASDKIIERKTEQYDICEYPINHFLRLCYDGNPNILEWLFVPTDCIDHIDDRFKSIYSHRQMYLTKKLYHKFKGYMTGQLQKLNKDATPHLGAKRKADYEKYGYPTKNAAHLIRLGRMGCEVLEQGKMLVRRPDAGELLDIRNGVWTKEWVLAAGNALLERMDIAFKTSALPADLSIETVKKALMDIYLPLPYRGNYPI